MPIPTENVGSLMVPRILHAISRFRKFAARIEGTKIASERLGIA